MTEGPAFDDLGAEGPRCSVFDALGAYRAVLQGRVVLEEGPRCSVKAQRLILATLVSLANRVGYVPEEYAPSLADLKLWHDIDEREARAVFAALVSRQLIDVHEREGAKRSFTIRHPFEGTEEGSPRARTPSQKVPPTNRPGVVPTANRLVVHEDPPAHGLGVPPAIRPGVGGADQGSTSGSTERSEGERAGNQTPRSRVAAPVPPPSNPPPPPGPPIPIRGNGPEPASTGAAPPDPALDSKRRKVARGFMAPEDGTAWTIWEILVRSEPLRTAEDRDGSVEPGSLARMANGISGKLMTSAARPEVGTRVAEDLVRELESASAAAGSLWVPPTMKVISSMFSRWFSTALGKRGIGPAPMSARAPAGLRVPDATGHYGAAEASRVTNDRLRGTPRPDGGGTST